VPGSMQLSSEAILQTLLAAATQGGVSSSFTFQTQDVLITRSSRTFTCLLLKGKLGGGGGY
jgi:hypothetical protein